MQKSLSVLLVTSLMLAGCGGWRDSRVNPGNWFGKSRAERVEPAEEVNPLLPQKTRSVFAKPEPVDLSEPVAEVTELRVEQTTTGVIIYAAGVADRQGPYEVALRPDSTPEEEADGILTLSLRVVYPRRDTPVGTARSRTVRAAHSMTKYDIRSIRTIRVVGRDNVRTTRRR